MSVGWELIWEVDWESCEFNEFHSYVSWGLFVESGGTVCFLHVIYFKYEQKAIKHSIPGLNQSNFD